LAIGAVVVGVVVVAAAGAAFKRAMPFKVGDWVVHPLHGVGRVIALERKQFAAGPNQAYYEIAIAQGTLWVQVDSPPAGLRGLTTKGELPQYRAVLQSSPMPLNKDYHQRRGELRERLKAGTLQSKCEVVRDLTAHGWAKRLSEPDAALLRATRDGLCREWAESEAVTVAEATHEVEELLREARQIHTK
jgi:CarD family transcriptional regulator